MPFIIAKDESFDNEDTVDIKQSIKHNRSQNETQKSTNEMTSWDNFKENIQPISQGRVFEDMMKSLKLVEDTKSRQQLLDERKKKFNNDLELCKDDLSKQLDLWSDYINWLEQNIPDGGKANGILNGAIEECIEVYYDKKEFKQDMRLLKIFMKFKRFCDEPIEVFGFMYANSICILLAKFYLDWSWQYEVKKNLNRAEDIIRLGLKNLASPRELLEEAHCQLKHRIDSLIRAGELDDCPEISLVSSRESQRELAEKGIRAALQTLKFKVDKNKNTGSVPIKRVGSNAVDVVNVGGLKSQTKLVNGVQVVPKVAASAKSINSKTLAKKSIQKPVQVFHDNGENDPTKLIKKIPTSQGIRAVGRINSENQPTSSGVLSLVQQQQPKRKILGNEN